MWNNRLTNNKAFSLVEIMFVVAIIALLSVSWVSYFNTFVDIKRLDTDMFFIKNNLDLLDFKVKNKEIYDYEAAFSWSNNYVLYKLNQTIKKLDTKLILDNSSKNFTLSTNFTSTWAWDIRIYWWNKLIHNKILNQINTFTGKMDNYQNYEIKSKLETGNDLLGVFYYNEESLSNTWFITNFIEANTKPDKTWTKSNNFVIKNINSRHFFYSWSTSWQTDEVYLFFEKSWVEKSIKIIK